LTHMSIDHSKTGTLVGLELHQQLNSKEKLFCSCPPIIHEDEPSLRFRRRLRPTQSELGQVDQAALFEFHKGKTFMYEMYDEGTCLVEADSNYKNCELLA
jgi:glutamyl-tRNA(Gln) amidotransferase subunit E